ncbi:MAG: SDR family oxidoreductase [Betaproteobacteria bacterium]|nr:SDR family oxidoreductase [Betaproteobacteria bacterium]
MRFSGRRVVITGAASGIGLASAEAFAREGARIAIVDRDASAAQRLAHSLGAQGCDVLMRVSDVADPSQVERDADAILTAWGGVDVLVASAGWSSGGIATTISVDDWQQTFRINVDGTWLWARALIPSMQSARSGVIITLASQLAIAGGRGNIAYVAAKGAIMSMTRTMALDYVNDGIRINAVAPGATDTPLLRRAFARSADPDAASARLAARHAMGRLGKPEEIAAAISFLASDEASFITGTVLPVEGGWLAA